MLTAWPASLRAIAFARCCVSPNTLPTRLDSCVTVSPLSRPLNQLAEDAAARYALDARDLPFVNAQKALHVAAAAHQTPDGLVDFGVRELQRAQLVAQDRFDRLGEVRADHRTQALLLRPQLEQHAARDPFRVRLRREGQPP